MFSVGDVVRSPWGTGVVLSNETLCGATEYYVLWVGFAAHGLGAAPFRVTQEFSDEGCEEYWEKVGDAALPLSKVIGACNG